MNAFETLGLPETALEEDIRKAYHALAKTCHPDLFTDQADQAAAQEKMVRLNLAYKEALTRCVKNRTSHYVVQSPEKAMAMARTLFERRQYDRALVQLSHIADKDTAWFALEGQILMAMGQYSSALQAFKICVKNEPDVRQYHEWCLAASVALRRSQKLPYRIADWAKGILRIKNTR